MSPFPPPQIDIIIPVYNEGENIMAVLDSLQKNVKTLFRVLICYDRDEDDTLTAIQRHPPPSFALSYVRNRGTGALGAVLSGFMESSAPAVLVFPADDDYNAGAIDALYAGFLSECDIVVASRFIAGGCMEGCPLLKSILVRSAAWFMRRVARVPCHDPTNGLRLFSRRVINRIPVESVMGFAFSMELLVKCHRLGWRIGEVPIRWYERTKGKSRFRTIRWIPQYLRWVCYAMATTWLRRPPSSVVLRHVEGIPNP